MKRKITKLTAAAVIVAGAALSITLFDGSLAPAFGIDDVWAATAKAEWVHMIWQHTEPHVEPNNIAQQKVEGWVSINPRRHIYIFKNGFAHFTEYNDATGVVKTQYYNSQTNVLATHYSCTDKVTSTPTTFADSFHADISRLQSEGATVEYTHVVSDGRPAMIIDLTEVPKSGPYKRFSMLVDVETRLPKRLVLYTIDSSGEREAATVTFDYPGQGPADIYQVGAARDAVLEVIDHRPSAEFLEAIRPYRTAKENLPGQRIVVDITNENDARYRVCVIYTDGKKERFEHRMWVRKHAPPNTDDPDEILHWALTAESDELGIQLYDGQYVHRIERDYRNRWTGYKRYSLGCKPDYVVGGLIHRAWPAIRSGKPVSNTYSNENNLLCIETWRGPHIEDKRLLEPAEKTLYYIDPEHDYICVRTESFCHLPAPQGNLKVDELDFDPNGIPSEPYLLSEVTKFGRTDSTKWYPSEITTNRLSWWRDYPGNATTLEEKFVIRLYVHTSPQFPDDVFDPQSLPDVNE